LRIPVIVTGQIGIVMLAIFHLPLSGAQTQRMPSGRHVAVA